MWGGLFAREAKKEYLEARRLGVFFISLSQIYLSREEKDHLLLEVPSSIESIVDGLFQENHLELFGRKTAIIHPETDRGKIFAHEFWSQAQLKGIKVTDVLSYKKGTKDYRKPVKKLLGLEYRRERQEEYNLLEKIYAHEGKHSMRRVQVLRPQIDFDWVFIPAFPLEAVQIIPSFNYFDASNVKIIGGSSWRSKRLSRESYKFKKIYFLGDDSINLDDFNQWFLQEYGLSGGVIEMIAFDAFKITDFLLKQKEFESRNELDIFIRGLDKLSGRTGSWNQVSGVWIKKTNSFHLNNGKIVESNKALKD